MTRNQKIAGGVCLLVAVVVVGAVLSNVSIEIVPHTSGSITPATPTQMALGLSVGLALVGAVLLIPLSLIGLVIWLGLRLFRANAKTPPN